MRTDLSLVELAQKIQDQANLRRDFVSDTRNIRATDTANLVVETESNQFEFKPTNHTYGQIATVTGIPTKYVRRMQSEAPALLANNLNHWFQNNPSRHMIRTLGPNARAFLSDSYQPIDNDQVAELLLPKLLEMGDRNRLHFASMSITDRKLYLKLTTDKLQGAVAVGDEVRGGMVITNSEIGQGRISIHPFIERLICTNGMARTDLGMAKTHVGRKIDFTGEIDYSDTTLRLSDELLVSALNDAIAHCLSPDTFERILNDMRAAQERSINGDVPKAVEVASERFGFSKGEGESILDRLIRDPNCGISQWGLINAVTRTAEDTEDYDRASELESIGGKMLTMPESTWKQIAGEANIAVAV